MGLVFSSYPRYIPINRRSIPEQIKHHEDVIRMATFGLKDAQKSLEAVKRGDYSAVYNMPRNMYSGIVQLPDAQRKPKFISYSKDYVNRLQAKIQESQQKIAELKSRQSSVGKPIAQRRTPRRTSRHQRR